MGVTKALGREGGYSWNLKPLGCIIDALKSLVTSCSGFKGVSDGEICSGLELISL